MDEKLDFKPFGWSALALALIGWGGLYLVVSLTLPFVWPRWGFFALLLMALTGTVLPAVFYLHQRFPTDPPAHANVLVRQAMWVGVYGVTLAWLQLGRLVTLYVILGLAAGLMAAEYFIRYREKANRRIPSITDDNPS
ncbi:MAG TPA: hypothetical protein PKL78_07940 [Anaerolineales bacterium]|nr:hypothetical protein [Anaerolineales bacterium]HNN13473.1 hypothetical protein [Anaerolineales bacterium]HNO30371.1 hypothetical protein [Anaerolineales bacterium]